MTKWHFENALEPKRKALLYWIYGSWEVMMIVCFPFTPFNIFLTLSNQVVSTQRQTPSQPEEAPEAGPSTKKRRRASSPAPSVKSSTRKRKIRKTDAEYGVTRGLILLDSPPNLLVASRAFDTTNHFVLPEFRFGKYERERHARSSCTGGTPDTVRI